MTTPSHPAPTDAGELLDIELALENEDLKRRLASLSAQVAELTTQANNFRNQVGILRHAMTDYEELQKKAAQVEALKKERDELRREFAACEGALKNAGNVCLMRAAENADLIGDGEDLRDELRHYQAEHDKMAAQVEALSKALAFYEDRGGTVAREALNAAHAPAAKWHDADADSVRTPAPAEREKALEEALGEIARQKFSQEILAGHDEAEFDEAYDMMIETARRALSRPKEG
jgi:chromosome segregation ATPase